MPQIQPQKPPTWSGRTVYLASVLGGATQATVVGAELKAGGQGTVYRDANRPDFVMKISHRRTPEDRDRTLAMLSAPPSAQVAKYSGANIIQIAWPQQLLLDKQGQFIGFSMSFLDKSRTTSLAAWTNPRERAHFKLSRDDRVRVTLAANLASVTDHVHKAGHALVDLKPDNVQAYRHGYVCLLDCDGFRIEAGGRTFPATVCTPNWCAPEIQTGAMPTATIGEEQDRFSLALVIYQLLDNDIHPFSGIDTLQPHQSWDIATRIARFETFFNPARHIVAPSSSHHPFFADETLGLFRRAFLDAPDQRPTAADWTRHLQQLVLRGMHACANNGEHWHYGKGCPWCSSQIPHQIPPPINLSPPVAPLPLPGPPRSLSPPPPLPPSKTLPNAPSFLKAKRKTAIALFLLGSGALAGLAYNPFSDTPVLTVVERPNPPSPPPPLPRPRLPSAPQPPSEHELSLAEATDRLDKLRLAWEQQQARLDALEKQRMPAPMGGGPNPGPGGGAGTGPGPGPPGLGGTPHDDRANSANAASDGTIFVQPPPMPAAIVTRYQRLARRATVVRRALTALRTSLAARDLTLRGDITAFELQMDDAMHAAADAIERRQEQEVIAQLDKAERAIEPLERFLNL